jgi:hypothetical protein
MALASWLFFLLRNIAYVILPMLRNHHHGATTRFAFSIINFAFIKLTDCYVLILITELYLKKT